MIGDPPIQRESFLAHQEVVIMLISFVSVLGISYYQEGCDLWAQLGSIVLNLFFISYESVQRLSAHIKIAFAKPFSVLSPGFAEVPDLVRKFRTTCGSSAYVRKFWTWSGSSRHLSCNGQFLGVGYKYPFFHLFTAAACINSDQLLAKGLQSSTSSNPSDSQVICE